MNYLVVEAQTYADDTGASIKYDFSDPTIDEEERKALAEEKYHQVLAAAARSKCKLHSAVLQDYSGRFLKREQYEHKVMEITPTEEES